MALTTTMTFQFLLHLMRLSMTTMFQQQRIQQRRPSNVPLMAMFVNVPFPHSPCLSLHYSQSWWERWTGDGGE